MDDPARREGGKRMRLSEWRAAAPTRDAMTAKVLAVIEPVVERTGADPDPHCWVAWADDPSVRYTIFVPVAPGLSVVSVRVNVPGEGPRASAKLVRWSRVQVGDLTVETQAGHRVATFQLEQHVLRAGDAAADRISRFALAVLAAIDGRPIPELSEGRGRRPVARKAGAKKATASGATKAPRAAAAASAAGARSSAGNGSAARRPAAGRTTTPALGPGPSLTTIPGGSSKPA
ncbi:MAG: hypothetical protein ACJ77B_06570 [Chloroflexota bacterium]